SGASAAVVGADVACKLPVLRAENPRATFTRILQLFAPEITDVFPTGIHPTALVHENAELGDVASIGAYAVIGAGVKIASGVRIGSHVVIEPGVQVAADCLIHAHVTIRERCRLGRQVILHPGAVIGSDGFGFHPGPEGLVHIPQIGIVVLEDRVEIGANSCIDRATTGETRIGAGTKIDNLVQIAHNVRIGANTAISAQTGISGSCVVGDGVTMGGQVGMGDHLSLGDGVKVAAKSGLTRDVPSGQTVFGYPAVEFRRGFKLVALTHRLPEFLKRLIRLEEILGVKDEES
ncbi:UDP-3-O-(3-hydroxymyristoyl)glucosamine N-acyltransferase, partial [bacterium]|nr:UDP-3-O-(3-hydroxymyristoyl)glucosamine N-acyltransferase [bacterium]